MRYIYNPFTGKLDTILSATATAGASGVDGSIQFALGGVLSSDTANLFWDNTNKRLGIGTNTPLADLHVNGELIRFDDTNASINNRVWYQIWNSNNQKMLEIGSISNGNPEIRFGTVCNTRIGFPSTDPNYFAFINDYTELWLGCATDDTLYFNYYVGSSESHGASGNRQEVNYYVGAGSNGFNIDGDLRVTADIGIGAASSLYFGNEAVNNTWRIVRSGTKLSFQRREAGIYVEKGFYDT
jgi:hypothetical protein